METTTFKRAEPKEIKKALKAHFKCDFSVRRGRGTGYHWIRVAWTDGPTEKDVRAFCGQYNDTARDDLTTDLWCGSQYTKESRSFSPGYCWLTCNELDLRKTPTLEAQVRNLYTMICRQYSYQTWSARLENPYEITGEKSHMVEVYWYDVVKKALKAQGHIVELINDGAGLRITAGNLEPISKPEAQESTRKPIVGEYKGHPVLTLPNGERGFTFGLAKAQAILEHIEAIKEFVETA